MKVLVINPGSCKYSSEEIIEIEQRMAKSMKENGLIVLNDCYFKCEVIDVDDLVIEKGE